MPSVLDKDCLLFTRKWWRRWRHVMLCSMTLTLPVPIPDEASKSFMKALKAFIKPFETPQRKVKIKIQLNFYFNTTFRKCTRRLGLKIFYFSLFHFWLSYLRNAVRSDFIFYRFIWHASTFCIIIGNLFSTTECQV